MEDLRDLTLAIKEYDVSAVVVTAERRSFSAGADLAVLRSDDPADSERLRELYGTVFEGMRNEPIPVVAGARGHVVGAGASLLCYAADLRVAAKMSRSGGLRHRATVTDDLARQRDRRTPCTRVDAAR